MRRNLLVLLLIIATSIFLFGCDGGLLVEEKDVFTVGLEADYAPFNWTQMDDSAGAVAMDGLAEYAGGYDIEIAKRIAEGLGKELVIVKTEWNGLLGGVKSGVLDAIIAGMSPTADRALEIDFTDNYYKSDLVMVVKKGGGYENVKSIQDFSGARIVGQQATFHDKVIDQIEGVIHETPADDFGVMRVSLLSGIVDGYVSERPEGISAMEASDELVMVEFEDGFQVSDDDVAIAVGLKKDSDELVKKINEILAGISEEERQEIMEEAIRNRPAS